MSDKITYVESNTSLRSLDIEILALFLFVAPFPLIIIAFIAGFGLLIGGSWTAFLVYLLLGLGSMFAAPGIWKIKKFSYIVVLIAMIGCLIFSLMGGFARITFGTWWEVPETAINIMGYIELVIYGFSIFTLLRNFKKFFRTQII